MTEEGETQSQEQVQRSPDRGIRRRLGQQYAAVVRSRRSRWEEAIPFVAVSPRVRTILCTANSIESLHSQVRKAIRDKGHFPSDEAVSKLIRLALSNITAKWRKPPKEWDAAKLRFTIQFGNRFVLAA